MKHKQNYPEYEMLAALTYQFNSSEKVTRFVCGMTLSVKPGPSVQL